MVTVIGTDTARHRRDVGGLAPDALEIDVADQAAADEIDADIDDDGAGAHHGGDDQIGRTRRDDQDIGQDRVLREVARLGVADRDGRLALHQHERERLADDVARADDGHVLAFELDALVLEDLLHAVGCAGREHGLAVHQAADIVEMEAVDIFFGRDRLDHAAHRDVPRKRKLDQDAVDRRHVVQRADALQHLALGDVRRQAHDLGLDADLGAGAHLVADIDRGGRIVADQDHGQRRIARRALCSALGALGDADADAPRDRDAVDDLGCHGA